jgi:hypothetical protein
MKSEHRRRLDLFYHWVTTAPLRELTHIFYINTTFYPISIDTKASTCINAVLKSNAHGMLDLTQNAPANTSDGGSYDVGQHVYVVMFQIPST